MFSSPFHSVFYEIASSSPKKRKYLILQSQKKGGDSVNGEVIAGGDEFLLNISLINVDVSYVISATKIEPITF